MSDDIRIKAADGPWVVRAGGAVIGESNDALEVHETGHPMVVYFPRKDIAMAFLDASDHRTTCPKKGEASHYSIQTKSVLIENAAWSYEDPLSAVSAIKGLIAFYPSERVTVEEL